MGTAKKSTNPSL